MSSSSTNKSNTEEISRRSALKGLGGLVASAALPTGATSPSVTFQSRVERPISLRTQHDRERPNIVWITGEGVPINALSCYGSKLIDTPNIDRIASEGMRFRNAFTTNALCAPSRATLLTGTYSHINGTIANPGIAVIAGEPEPTFDESQITIAKLLKQHGYQTGTV